MLGASSQVAGVSLGEWDGRRDHDEL